jgi:uncharacterized protein (TIGR03083 family)
VDTIADQVAVERQTLADQLDDLDDDQWTRPSLCTGWRIREVVSHLVMPYEMSVPRLLRLMATNRFDFDRVADVVARRDERPAPELVAALRATAGRRFPPGGGPAAPLTHLVVHGQDIRRPLGLNRTGLPAAHANVTLDQLTSPKASGLRPSGLLDGFRFVSTDTGWTHGAGAEVAGSAADLITTLAGRPSALDGLTGAGVARLRGTLTPQPGGNR